MRVLIVEDDQNKLAQLNRWLGVALPGVDVREARSYRSGMGALVEGGEYDLVLLDMTMPTYDVSISETGGQPRVFGGREILRRMQKRGLTSWVILVTQFESFGEGVSSMGLQKLDRALRSDYPGGYVGYVKYDPGSGAWQERLAGLVTEVQARMEARHE